MNSRNRNLKSEGSPESEIRLQGCPVAGFGVRCPELLRYSGLGIRIFTLALYLFTASAFSATNAAASDKLESEPETARDFFNAGTRLLKAGKLGEAEAYLQAAVAKQNRALQPAALFNLGHARFAQGQEELKKAEDGGKAASRARRATAQANAANQTADAALASNDVKRMVDAYRRGRGARRELKAATKAVQQAMESHAGVLLKWQRAADDFRSASELNPADTHARENAEIVNRHLARLIDQIRDMQQALAAAAQAQQQLGDKVKQLRGRIPAEDAPPGEAGEDGEEEEGPYGMRPEMQEAPGRTGEEQRMSPEEAGQMLDGLRRDGDRRLPMGQGEQAEPRTSNKPTW